MDMRSLDEDDLIVLRAGPAHLRAAGLLDEMADLSLDLEFLSIRLGAPNGIAAAGPSVFTLDEALQDLQEALLAMPGSHPAYADIEALLTVLHANASAIQLDRTILFQQVRNGLLPGTVTPEFARALDQAGRSYAREWWFRQRQESTRSVHLGSAGIVYHDGAVLWCTHSGDGRRAATAGVDRTVALWDAMTGRADVPSRIKHRHRVTAVAFGPDGDVLASASADRTICLWNAISGRLQGSCSGHDDEVTALAWHPDGGTLATASRDQTLRLWDARACASHSIQPTSSTAIALSWSLDGTRLAGSGEDGSLQLWTVTAQSRGERAVVPVTNDHSSRTATVLNDALGWRTSGRRVLAWSPDGTRIATAAWDGTVQLFDPRSGLATALLVRHSGYVHTLAWAPSGRILATGAGDGVVRLWWLDATSRKAMTLIGHTGYIMALEWSSDEQLVISAGADGTIRVWEVVTGAQVAWNPTGTRVLALHSFTRFDETAATLVLRVSDDGGGTGVPGFYEYDVVGPVRGSGS
jgi:WD40 repeat protein